MVKRKMVRGDGGLIHSVNWYRDVGAGKSLQVTTCGIWMLNYPGKWTVVRGHHKVSCFECIAKESA